MRINYLFVICLIICSTNIILAQSYHKDNKNDYDLLLDKYLSLDIIKTNISEPVYWTFHCRILPGWSEHKERLIIIYEKNRDSLFYKFMIPKDSSINSYYFKNVDINKINIPMDVYEGYVNNDIDFYNLVKRINSNYCINLLDMPSYVLDADYYECTFNKFGQLACFRLNSFDKDTKQILILIDEIEKKILEKNNLSEP
ncbi:MAG: hypothetical protein GXX85_01740 [Ignavibacteria bacterium]|nr:hypothetical protein [Ignavibacteria bacterium]